MKEMNLKVVEEFLKNNPDFSLYIANSEAKTFTKVISINNDTDFDNLESGYIINDKIDTIALVNIIDNPDMEIYKLVKNNDCN